MIVADLLDKASAWLQDQRHRFLCSLIVYQRGSHAVELAATIGRTVYEQADEYGIVQKTESRDFLVRTSDLVIGGMIVLPKCGDRIRENSGAQTFIYEVMTPTQRAESPWRYSDPQRRTLRIHTKLIAMEGV